MKTKILFFITVTITTMLIGCQSTSLGVYDSSVPPEKLCTLEVDINLKVKEFDGKKVSWGHSITAVNIQIPEGAHKFLIDYSGRGNSSHIGGTDYSGQSWGQTQTEVYSAYDISFEYDFVAGNTYVMYPQSDGDYVFIGVGKK
jgi:hypothetical protein